MDENQGVESRREGVEGTRSAAVEAKTEDVRTKPDSINHGASSKSVRMRTAP